MLPYLFFPNVGTEHGTSDKLWEDTLTLNQTRDHIYLLLLRVDLQTLFMKIIVRYFQLLVIEIHGRFLAYRLTFAQGTKWTIQANRNILMPPSKYEGPIRKSPSYCLPPTNLSKLLIILLVFSILSIAWIIAAALSLSPFLQIVMLIVVPFHNLEIGDSDDPPLGVYIESRFLVNSEPIELLTFLPLMLCIFGLKHLPEDTREAAADYVDTVDLRGCPNPIDLSSLCRPPPNDIQALSGYYMTPSLIHRLDQLKVQESMYSVSTVEAAADYVDTVDLRGCPNPIDPSSLCRPPPNDIQALSGYYMTPSLIYRSEHQFALLVRLSMTERFLKQLAKFCSNHDPVLVVSLAGRTIQDVEKFEQWVDLLHLFQTPDVRVPPSDK
nr:hypothetical protein [Tanacetum cinerariifolium]